MENEIVFGEAVLNIVDEVIDEITYAQKKWGNEFDSKNTLNDWATYASVYLGRATEMGATPDHVRKNLIKAAGLLVNAIKWHDSGNMPKRHYD